MKKIKTINLLDYCEYNREKAIKTLEREYGYKPYGEKHGESKFTKWFQNIYLYHHHKIDKRKPHLSSLIHSGQMTRSGALELLKNEPERVDHPFEGEDAFLIETPPKHYPTNEKWVNRWQKFFNILKRCGYSR